MATTDFLRYPNPTESISILAIALSSVSLRHSRPCKGVRGTGVAPAAERLATTADDLNDQ
jgi:hypothetical protein